MSGYVRQSAGTIVTSNTIQASDFNNEFNALLSAFDKTTGHTHGGATGEGAPLPPSSFTGLSSNGIAVRVNSSTFAARTITGTTNKLDVTNGDGVAGNPTLTISATYVGQTSITTLGTVTTGTFSGTLGAISGAPLTNLTAANISAGTAGISITGNAATATTAGTTTGNAGTATALQTARTINTVSFDGTANIVVTAAAGTLTGTTLNSSVVTSSLTSVGTLANLTVTNPIAGSITGNAATVTTNANLTGAVTSVGNATSLGSFTSANLAIALTDETGSGAAVFGTSPTIATPTISSPTISGTVTGSLTWTNSQSFSGEVVEAFSDKTTVGLSVTSSTTYQDIPGFSWVLQATATYSLVAYFRVSQLAAGGHKIGTAYSGTTTFFRGVAIGQNGTALLSPGDTGALGDVFTSTTGTTNYVTVHVRIITNAGGTFKLQFAQQSSSGTASIIDPFTVASMIRLS